MKANAMTRDPRYDILFEPLQIGPVKAKNRFYQVPHCTGMGWLRPQTLAEMRGVKAEGGWGVVCTEYNSIHPSSDDLPHASASLWNDSDVRAHRLMTDKVHEHGALAGAELWYGGVRSANLMTREVSMDVGSLPNSAGHPFQTRAMDRTDIRNLRRWHRKAALRARDAGFDIVYVYATHTYLLSNFLSPTINQRGDEYGGSLENRTRLVREIIEDTKEAVGDRCAVAVRFAADQEIGEDGVPIQGERLEMFDMMAELPDLWDINIASYTVEMGVSRFTKEAALEPYMSFIKSRTTKPVVTVGRFTSPDTMVSQIKRGVTDLIGAARPSIADPFLPKKIETGELSAIRECIGCNICYSGDSLSVPIRCTQNPTMGEEWRKGWHPEKMQSAGVAGETVLIVGAGPAGMEAARASAKRGYKVLLAEAGTVLGGRLPREAALKGMSEYIRVRDYREQSFVDLPNLEVYLDSTMTPDDIFGLEPDHVAIATGAKWHSLRFDGEVYRPIAMGEAAEAVLTVEDILDGKRPAGKVIVYDEDGYYMGGVVAETLREAGAEVTLVTPSEVVSEWAENTSERWRIRTRLMEQGIGIELAHAISHFDGSQATLVCEFTEEEKTLEADSIVMVTQRVAQDELYWSLIEKAEGNIDKLPFSLKRIGDCEAPAIVAAAVYAGHKFAREIGEEVDLDVPMKHDRVDVGAVLPSSGESDEPSQVYLETLKQYYEEEVEGEAYFAALASQQPTPERRDKMQALADVEATAAKSVLPLLAKYKISPKPSAELRKSGTAQARDASEDWSVLVNSMLETFPGYVDDFERLESLAPEHDLPALKVLTAHEVAAIQFLECEATGRGGASLEPLNHYMETGRALA